MCYGKLQSSSFCGRNVKAAMQKSGHWTDIFVDHDLNSVDGEAESPKMDLPLPGFCGGFCHLDALTPCNMYDKYL